MELLQRWRDFYQEAVGLTDAIERLPEACECGDAGAHLEGRCRCCGRHPGTHEARSGSENCTALLARLRADLLLLDNDLSRVAAPVEAATCGRQRLGLLREVLMAGEEVRRLMETLERLSAAVVGFHRTCALSEMRSVKSHSVALREHCERLNARMRTPPEKGGQGAE